MWANSLNLQRLCLSDSTSSVLCTFSPICAHTWPPPAPLCAGWRPSRTWSSTEPPRCWPWTASSAAQPWIPAPPHTVPAAGHSRGGRTAGRGPGRSWPVEVVTPSFYWIFNCLILKFQNLFKVGVMDSNLGSG